MRKSIEAEHRLGIALNREKEIQVHSNTVSFEGDENFYVETVQQCEYIQCH